MLHFPATLSPLHRSHRPALCPCARRHCGGAQGGARGPGWRDAPHHSSAPPGPHQAGMISCIDAGMGPTRDLDQRAHRDRTHGQQFVLLPCKITSCSPAPGPSGTMAQPIYPLKNIGNTPASTTEPQHPSHRSMRCNLLLMECGPCTRGAIHREAGARGENTPSAIGARSKHRCSAAC